MENQGKKKVNKKGIVIALICFVVFVIIICTAPAGDETAVSSSQESLTSSQAETEATNKYETEKYLTTFEGVKATFQKMIDPQAGVTTFNVLIKFENSSSKNVTVSLTDGYVNDTAVTFFSGLPVTVNAGKNAIGSFGFGYQNLGFSKIDDVKKIEFKITLTDENYKMSSSETVSVEF